MIRNGNKIRLTRDEQAFLSGLCLESVNPQTVDEYNAWIEVGVADFSETDPEERLFKRAIESMRIEG